MKRTILLLLALAVVMIATVGAAAAMAQAPKAAPTQQAPTAASGTITVPLMPVGGSGVRGFVVLQEASSGGTQIAVQARNLRPGNKYVSLYYENHTCALEPYSQDDVIGGSSYTANNKGIGRTSGTVDDSLADINSVSVRSASNFKLLACADVHPG